MNSTHHFAMHEKTFGSSSANVLPKNHIFVAMSQGEGGRSMVAAASWEGAVMTIWQ